MHVSAINVTVFMRRCLRGMPLFVPHEYSCVNGLIGIGWLCLIGNTVPLLMIPDTNL